MKSRKRKEIEEKVIKKRDSKLIKLQTNEERN